MSDRLRESFFIEVLSQMKLPNNLICNYLVWFYIPACFSQMNPVWPNVCEQLILLYSPPLYISTQCSVSRLFGSPRDQRQCPVSFVVWFIQAFVSFAQHHFCEKYRKPMNHRGFWSAPFCSLLVVNLKYFHSPSVCMETRPSKLLLLQYCWASSQFFFSEWKWYLEQTCSTFSECNVKGGKMRIDMFN